MLNEITLDGQISRVEIAIERIRMFADIAEEYHENGYYVCISGGKDSSVIQQLCIMSGVKCEFFHNHTSVDHPKTVYFVRDEKKRVEDLGYKFTVAYAVDKNGKRKTMWNMIPLKGLPTRLVRWCCAEFKEGGGEGRYVITGVRWAESTKRKSRAIHETIESKKENRILLNNDNDWRRKMTEHCVNKGKLVLNPIIDWSDADVWEFIKRFNLPYNPLYDEGYSRVGCVGCPQGKNAVDLANNPKYRQAYSLAAGKYLLNRSAKGKENYGAYESGEKYMQWWEENKKAEFIDENQLEMEVEE